MGFDNRESVVAERDQVKDQLRVLRADAMRAERLIGEATTVDDLLALLDIAKRVQLAIDEKALYLTLIESELRRLQDDQV